MEDATQEVQFFFPVEQTVAVIKPPAVDQRGVCVCGGGGGGEDAWGGGGGGDVEVWVYGSVGV